MRMLLHLLWSGPYSVEEALQALNDEGLDYGVYQIYGTHLVYGTDVLLYVGKAEQQTFRSRLTQHAAEWMRAESNAHRLTVPCRTPCGRADARRSHVESPDCPRGAAAYLRAYACVQCGHMWRPICRRTCDRFVVFNWGQFRDMLPEVSGERWLAERPAHVL